MRSAAVILTQHRRSRRPAILGFDRALPRRIVQPRCTRRSDAGDARALPRTNTGKARAARRRHRPDAIVPRGYLPLVIH